jgi:5-methylcytosine-specific restriction endonuclease McrA
MLLGLMLAIVETRKLTNEERERARSLLEQVRESLKGLSGGDSELLFAYRRKIAKELMYDERSSPAKRKSLKRRKLISQDGKCALCGGPLPPGGLGSVLDRLNAIDGYTDSNTRLLCRDCDLKTQRERSFSG